jgi:ABC-2 type transport system ATP-binding protein
MAIPRPGDLRLAGGALRSSLSRPSLQILTGTSMGVTIQNLTKVYHPKILSVDDVSLQVDSGVLGLLGPNGAGKTTLMRILATLLDPTSGTATVDGYDVRRRPEVRRILGYLPQQFGLYPQMTCVEFLQYIGLLYGLPRAERREAVDRALHQVHMEEFASRRISALSGGMKQRLGIAQAVLAAPRLLIVDEPTAGLDPEERIRVRNLLGELARERVVILSTHIVGDVTATATSLALMRKGKLIFHGTQAGLLEQVRDRVWLARVDEARLPQLKLACLVTGISHTAEGLEARVLHEEPSGLPGVLSAVRAEPGLEDAYIHAMGGTADGGGTA